MVARRGDTILMNERDWEDIQRWAEGDVRKVPTPDKVWQELLRRAPKTAARSKSLKEWRGLVDYICEVHRDAQQAADALQMGNKRYDDLQRAYLEDKAIMVELARALANVLTITERGDYVECKLPFELIREFLERTRPLVVAAGTEELKHPMKTVFNPNTFDVAREPGLTAREEHRLRTAHKMMETGLISKSQFQQEFLGELHTTDPEVSARRNIAKGLGVPEEFLDPTIPNKEK